MSLVAHDGKVVSSGGKALTFDTLIALANATTGENDKTLAAAVASLIEGYGQGGGASIETGSIVLAEDSSAIKFKVNTLDDILAVAVWCADKQAAESQWVSGSTIGFGSFFVNPNTESVVLDNASRKVIGHGTLNNRYNGSWSLERANSVYAGGLEEYKEGDATHSKGDKYINVGVWASTARYIAGLTYNYAIVRRASA